MAEYENNQGIQMDSLDDLVSEFSLEDLAEFDAEFQFDPKDVKPAKPEYTKKQKRKMLWMNNTATAIIKWCFAFLGIVGAVLFILAMAVPGMSDTLSTMVTPVVRNVLTTVTNMIPFSVLEILAVVVAGGLVLYIGFLVWRTIVAKNGHKAFGYWIQFLYTLLAIGGVGFLLFTLCYGVTLNRTPLYKNAFADYQPNLYLEQNLDNSLIYFVDRVNNTAADGIENESIFYTATGHSRYDAKGRSTKEIAKLINQCYVLAAQDYPALKGDYVEVKETMASPLYTSMGIGSMYSPITGEVLINPDYPEVAAPMQIAQAIAKQRGYADDGESRFIAFLVCTKYADMLAQQDMSINVDFIKYSAYMDAYMDVGSVAYSVGYNVHLYCTAGLKESAKKDMIAYVEQLDMLYGNLNALEFIPAGNKTSTADYRDIAKLVYVDFNTRVNNGSLGLTFTTPEKPVNVRADKYMYSRYLVAYFLTVQDEFTQESMDLYASYNPEALPNDGTGGMGGGVTDGGATEGGATDGGAADGSADQAA